MADNLEVVQGRVEEEQNLWQKMNVLGSDIVSTFTHNYEDHRRKAVAALAVGSAMLGGGIDLLTPETAAAGASRAYVSGHTAECVRGSTTANVKYTNQAILPLAKEIISTYDHAKPSEKYRKNNLNYKSDLGYDHLTEIKVTIPTQIASNHRDGDYLLEAEFKGSIKPSNVMEVAVDDYAAKATTDLYGVMIEKSKMDIPYMYIGVHWLMESIDTYGSKELDTWYSSKVANGTFESRYKELARPLLNASLNQAERVIGRIQKHQLIVPQKNLGINKKLTKDC